MLPPEVREDRAVVEPAEAPRPTWLAWSAVEELGEPVAAALVRRDVALGWVLAVDPLIDRAEAERELTPPGLDGPASYAAPP